MTYPAMSNIRVNQQLGSEPVAATDKDAIMLAEKLAESEVPLKVLLQALAIAAYDSAAAFRYADQYLNKSKRNKRILLKSFSNSRKIYFQKK